MQEVSLNSQMSELIYAPWLSACIHLAAKRSFADIIEAANNHQASIEHISQEAKVHPVWTRAILQALATAHIFVETEEHLFKNTPLSDCLRSDHPQTLKWQASILLGSRLMIQLSQLEYTIDEAGTSIIQRLWGEELYELYEKQGPDKSTRLSPENVIIELEPRADFDLGLERLGAITDPAIAHAYPFKGSICDLGGGRGSLLTAIARQHPDVESILFEQQFIIDNLKRKQIEYPFSLVAGDFFQQVPHADIYLLKQVLHNWPDDLCIEILKKCAEANPDAKVLVIERLIGDPQSFAELTNIIMISSRNGAERTLEEYESICKSAGFSQLQLYSTKSMYAILELGR